MADRPHSIIEVAKMAGVSTATVSRVLNGLPGVREETIAQVRAAADALHYTPLRTRSSSKRPPRRMRKLRTGNIALVTVGQGQIWLERPIMGTVLGGIQRGAQVHELRLLLGDMPDPLKPNALVAERQIDGAIVFLSSDIPIAMYDQTLRTIQQHVPVVWAMGLQMGIQGVDHVAPDNVGIGHLAFTHLAQLGCTHPAFLTIDPKWPLMRLRGQSFLNSAYDSGAAPTVFAVTEDQQIIESYGRKVVAAPQLPELIDKLAKSRPRPDGLFIANDFTTSRVYPLLQQTGIRISQELHVVSCDAEEARLSAMHPRPASIDIGADEIGYRSVNRLLNRIERPNGPPLIIEVAPHLHQPPAEAQ